MQAIAAFSDKPAGRPRRAVDLNLRRSIPAVLLALLVTGCASIGSEGPRGIDEIRQAARARGVDPAELVVPFELTDEMRAWAREAAPAGLPPVARLQRLTDLLLNQDYGSLEYTWGHTGTAIEVFEERRANCLSFTNLFVGMAREVGVDVDFLDVTEGETYRKEGDLVVISDHIAVGYDVSTDMMVFDFSPYRNRELKEVRKISDLTAIAMFYSNRGAESLQAGDVDAAVDWLIKAVLLDPELAHAWVNFGVALRRSGNPEGAERAYLKGLEVDPRIPSAYQNLVSLLQMQGRPEEAEVYQKALANSPNRNPFTYLSLGDISRNQGHLEEAQRFYRRALSLGCDVAECYAAMGQLAVARDDLRRARKMLKKARKADAENPRTVHLAGQLGSAGG